MSDVNLRKLPNKGELPIDVEDALVQHASSVGNMYVTFDKKMDANERLRLAIAKAIRAAEERVRERCAKVCDAMVDDLNEDYDSKAAAGALRGRIRSLPLETP